MISDIGTIFKAPPSDNCYKQEQEVAIFEIDGALDAAPVVLSQSKKMSCHLREEEIVEQKACSVDTIDTVDNSTTREASSWSAKERDQGQKTIFARTGGGGGVVWCSAGARGQFSTYLHQYQLLVSRVRARARAGTIG